MPISPKEIADKRLESTIAKLCDLIDKKLQESETLPFEFTFLPNTNPSVCTAIAETYRQVGWSASLETKDAKTMLILASKATFDDSLEAHQEASVPYEIVDEYYNLLQKKMSTEDGRIEIAQSMREPITTSMLYQAVTRKILMVDILGGKSPLYETEGSKNAIYCTKSREIAPYSEVDKSTPFLEIAAHVDLKPPFTTYKLDRAQVAMKDSMQAQEQHILAMLLQAAATHEQTIYTYAQTVELALLDAIGEIHAMDSIPAKMLVHPTAFRKLFMDDNLIKSFKKSTQRDVLMVGLYGHFIDELDVHVTTCIPSNEIFITPPAQFLGTWSVHEDITVLPCQSKSADGEDRFGFITYEKVLPTILYPETVRKVKVRW